MLQTWNEIPCTTQTARDVRILSLHILSDAGFGKSYSFRKSAEAPKLGHMFNYKDSLAKILDHILLLFVVGPKLLSARWLPKSISCIGQATIDFRAYMQDMYNEELELVTNGAPRTGNIMTSMIHASRAELKPQVFDDGIDLKPPDDKGKAFTEREVYGNTFVYNFAGHDTTAITFSYTIYLLAAHPEVQHWISEEILEHLKNKDCSTWNYSSVFPELKRCQAVLLEVLRLYNPLTGIIKSTGNTPRLIALPGKTITVPANTRVILNTDATHTHPRYWGDDSLHWRPQRWIERSPGPGSAYQQESLKIPPKGTYAAWSDGAGVCPGKRFSQVEFVAVLATLFHEHRVEPVAKGTEDAQSARDRVLRVVRDSGMVLLLQMRRPEEVALRWKAA